MYTTYGVGEEGAIDRYCIDSATRCGEAIPSCDRECEERDDRFCAVCGVVEDSKIFSGCYKNEINDFDIFERRVLFLMAIHD